jgi:branched-subunit amino acid transport protein
MTVFAVLVAAGLLSWALRVALITVVPASRLPTRVRAALDHVGPAVLAALLAAGLTRDGGVLALASPAPALLALLVSAGVAWRTKRLAASVGGAMGAFWLLSLLWARLT